MVVIITTDQFQEYQVRVAANDADLEASYWLGYCYYEETGGVENDADEAGRIWQEAMRHVGSNDNEQDNTGKIRFLLSELAIFRDDFDQAKELNRQAFPRLQWEAAQGDPHSQFYAGRCLLYGASECFEDSSMYEKDEVQAAFWLERSAEQGHRASQQLIGTLYGKGIGVEQDLVKAVEFFDKAAAKGCFESFTGRYLLLYFEVDDEGRERVLGCVQRNTWIKRVLQSSVLSPSLGVQARALEKVATCQNRWSSLSPTFLCVKEMIAVSLKANKDMRVRTSKRKCL
jgi:TPR repeat protein